MPAPILAGLISLIPQAITTITSIVKDKKDKKEAEVTAAGPIVDSLKEMVSGNISSKRMLNVGGTAIIIMHGISTGNTLVILIGASYSLGMAFITYLTERKQST